MNSLKHPGGHSSRTVLSAIGGPLLFWSVPSCSSTPSALSPIVHGVGILALMVLAWFGRAVAAFASAMTTLIMLIVAAWETISLIPAPPNLPPKPPRVNRKCVS